MPAVSQRCRIIMCCRPCVASEVFMVYGGVIENIEFEINSKVKIFLLDIAISHQSHPGGPLGGLMYHMPSCISHFMMA